LIEEAVSGAGKKTATRKKTLAEADVAGVFGIELAQPEADDAPHAPAKPKRRQSGAPAAKLADAPRRSPKASKRGKGKPKA
jgi:hypothetical protein